jgi:hypothetical protein
MSSEVESAPATITSDLARPRSVRFTDEDLELLGRLTRRLGRSQRDVLSMSLTHLWVSLQRDERVHLVLDEETAGADRE